MGEIVNPYIAGAPVIEQRMFFGREDIFQWIENSLTGQYADHILVVHGQRRVGKTSVLKQLGNRLPHRYIPVFFDLQGRTHTTLDHFLWWLAREIVRVLKQERAIEVSPPQKESFAADPEFFENQFLTSLQAHLGSDRLLLTFDEFDNLEESEVREELARPLIDHLRRLMGHPNLNFIFSIGSSGRKLENMQAAYTDFFKTALYKKISFLSEEQTHHLVTCPVAGMIEYEYPAVDRIYQIASGHPYFTQLTCHELFARCQRTEQRKIAIADVESVLDDVVERGTVNLKFVWDEASDIEKWSLAALVQLDKTDNRALAEFLRRNHVRFSETDLTSGLLRLREKDVLTPQNRFVIHLLHIWLQKNRPIEQVREELTESNPIASRFIEIGLEFRDSGQPEKAIEFFRQALSVASDNLQAQVNIALTYAAQGKLEQAIAEFEKALTIDDEDVASRSGLCDAHLALGDAAMKRGRVKDAVLSYQRVLAINAEHLEARGRMAELSRQRAEKALADGRDEEALSAFAEALKFTPEDQALIARSEKVRAEKNAKVLAEQISRSEKEAAARNWAKAVEALNAALEIAPGDVSILKRIETINQSQLREQLDALLAKVAAAEKMERWDAAIGGLNEYLQLKPDDTAVQKRIADLVEARHTAWQKAVLERVDHAVTAHNWDAALSALNEALRLEPDNAVMQARAGQVRAERRTAELNARLARAESAAGAGRWDEAIEVLNDGLAAEPENETLKIRLADARKARREVRLQAALRLAESAAQAGKWETAATSLQEVLVNEPENPEFIQKLAEIKALERESRLGGLETLAQSLLKAEKFDEALTAWNEYLALLPADREKAQAEIAAVKKAQTLASLYADAATTHASKNYEKAIELFKRIVAEDAEYKDTTDLLAEAVRLRRSGSKTSKIVFKKNWRVGVLLAGLALGIGALIVWAARNGLPTMPAVSTEDTKTPASAAQSASTETPTPDSAIQSALATIQSEEPLYQTSFDSWEFVVPVENASIESGKLIVRGGENQSTYVSQTNFQSDRFAIKFETQILESRQGGACILNIGTDDEYGIRNIFLPSGEVEVDHLEVDGYEITIGNGQFDPSNVSTTTLIVLNDQISLFVDGELAFTAHDPEGSAVYTNVTYEADSYMKCGFDNFKYWDLREMDFAVKTALATIQSEEPLYQTRFDNWDFGEPIENAIVENGKLIVNSKSQDYVSVGLPDLHSDKFAVEFNFRILESGTGCYFWNYPSDDGYGIGIGLDVGRVFLEHYESDQWLQNTDGYYEHDETQPDDKVTLIVVEDRITVLVNGHLAFTVSDPYGNAVYAHRTFAAEQRNVCEYDNYKIWDLRKTITVTSVEDSGPGTLRQALLDVQAGDVIKFDTKVFPPDSATTIFITSELPRISQGHITIDASDAGVILDGSKFQGSDMFGLIINSDYNTVMGLMFTSIKGIALYIEGGSYNTIGGDRGIGAGPLGQGNLISNNGMGIDLLSMSGGNVITGNLIGTDKSGREPMGNKGTGIWIENNQSYHLVPNTIGPDNVVAFNGNSGISIDNITTPTIITANSIHDNTGSGIFYNISDAARDALITPPTLLYSDFASGMVNGNTCKSCVVEIFSTEKQDGFFFEGTVTADEFGNFSFKKGGVLSGPFLTATTTLPRENTSEFSSPTSARSKIRTALEAIQNDAPTYQTGFDTWDFGIPVENARVENGKLIVSNVNDIHTFVFLDKFDFYSKKFAVEFETKISEHLQQGFCSLNVGNDDTAFRTIFMPSGQIRVDRPIDADDLIIGSGNFDPSISNTVTLIVLDEQFSLLINGEMAFASLDPEGSAIYTSGLFEANSPITCEFDDYKIWNLSAVDFNP